MSYGIVASKDVMVKTRDGIGLATDVYRPGREGDWADGRFPTVLCRTPYDKTDKRYTEIADFFVPRGYAVCLQDLRDRYRSEGTGDYFHTVTKQQGDDGYDAVEWIAAQPWSNGRVGTVGSSYAGITQVRLALERPPHLSAIWPDVVPTNSFQHQSREGGAMQLHMFWALFIHAQDAQDIRDDWDKQAEVWEDLKNLRELFWATPWKKGQLSLRHTPALEQSLIDYYTRGEYDEFWQRKDNDFTRYYDEHADVPGTFTTGWYDGFPHSDTEYFAAMAARNETPQRLIVGPWSHVGMRGDATWTLDVDFGSDSVWGVQRYFEEQLRFFEAYLREDGVPLADPPVRIFVMGGGSGCKTDLGKLDHGGRWRDEQEWPLGRTHYTDYYLGAGGILSPTAPSPARSSISFQFDPRNPVPTIGGNISSGSGILLQGAWDQRGSDSVWNWTLPVPLSARNDVLVFQTPPLEEDIEVTGEITVTLWASTDGFDTDFATKLLDVHPPTPDFPGGFDMNIADGIVRGRFRQGLAAERLLEPGKVYPFTLKLYPTSNVFRKGHRIRVDVASSNFPRFDVNPNTGEPLNDNRRTRVATNTIYHDRTHPSHITLPVIPASAR